MAELNKVFLMGRLTFDPELRRHSERHGRDRPPAGTCRTWTGRDGERREETLFIDVTVWDRQAETCCQYLKKGRAVHVEGSLKMDTWEDKNTGEKRSKIKVQADRVQFLDRRDDAGGGGPGGDDDYAAPAPRDPAPRRAAPEPRSTATAPPVAATTRPRRGRTGALLSPPVDSEDDDDIPF